MFVPPSIAEILRAVRSYSMYEVYPYTCFVDRDGRVLDTPSSNAAKIESWVIPFSDARGLVVHRINNEHVVLRAYEITDTLEEKDELVSVLYGRIVWLINKLDIEGARVSLLNKHVMTGIAVALGMDGAHEIIGEAVLRKRLEDRLVAIFGETVILLSRRKFMQRFDGRNAVEAARKYSFVLDAPISYISEKHIPMVLGNRVSVFVFPRASIICNYRMCFDIPLPSNITYLIARRVKGAAIVDLERGRPEDYAGKHLPAPYIYMHRGTLLLLEPEASRYVVRERHRTITGPPVPLVFSRRGFLGYGKLLGNKVVEVVKHRGGGREERDEYLEEVVLGG